MKVQAGINTASGSSQAERGAQGSEHSGGGGALLPPRGTSQHAHLCRPSRSWTEPRSKDAVRYPKDPFNVILEEGNLHHRD